jgi:astacin (peptidase family M12A)
MKRIVFIGAIIAVAFSAFAQPRSGSHRVDIRVLDRLLASAPANSKTVRAGDMILRRSYVQAARAWLAAGGRQPESAFAGNVVLWPGGIVPYVFDPGVSALHQKAFLDAATDWATFANVSFVARTSQTDYLYVQEGTNGDNSAGVGKLGGQQALTISAWTRNVICHEIGHTLGLVHEHQRSDRDGFVTIQSQNIQPGFEFAFAILPNSNNRGAYDFLSVMHYTRNAFATDPSLDTIVPKAGFTQYIDVMGNDYGLELSQSDRQGMGSIYGAGPALSAVVTNTKDSGVGSLRAAIFYAIDHANTTVTFNIPPNDPGHMGSVYVIQPSDVMTTPGPGTIIDGSTQPNGNANGPSIVLDGSLGPQPTYPAPAFYLSGANVTIRSLAIRNSLADGIQIAGAGATGNTIAGCFLGLDPTGAIASPNTYSGIVIANGAHGNVIGGTSAGAGNVISGNGAGITMYDTGTNQNRVEGNYIGLNADGTLPVPNESVGVTLFSGVQQNIIGGSAPGAGNIISGNAQEGVVIVDSTTSGNIVAGNLIGLDATGTSARPNGGSGVYLFGSAHDNVIGGTSAGERNFLSGNGGDGVTISDSGTNSNRVQGNTIGLNLAGTSVANSFRGVVMQSGAQNNLIGGSTTGAPNIISGNTLEGIDLFQDGTAGNTLQRNDIFNNGDLGIRLDSGSGAPNNLQADPTLTSAVLGTNNSTLNGATTISGNLNSTGSTNFRVEFFANALADASGFGEGQFYLGETNVVTNGLGHAVFSFQVQMVASVGQAIAATATNVSNGNSSEFSATVNVTATDSNGDGIPDSWATAHGFTASATIANDDTDGDGLTNLREFYAGLDPRNANSFLRLNVIRSGGDIQLTFQSVLGRIYRLEWRNSLTTGNWQSLLDGIIGTGSSMQLVDPQALNGDRRMYRLRVLPP